MILRTKIAWLKAKEESEEEKLKREVLGDDYVDIAGESEDIFDKTMRDVIIDTVDDKIYIQLHDDQVCIQRLLQTEFFPTENGEVTRYDDSIIIYSTLDEIHEQLLKQKNL